MGLSIYTVLTAILLSSIFFAIATSISEKHLHKNISINCYIVILSLLFIRIFVPIEFPMTTVVKSRIVLVFFQKFLNLLTFKIGNKEFNIIIIVWLLGAVIYNLKALIEDLRIRRFFNRMSIIKNGQVDSILVDPQFFKFRKTIQRLKIIQLPMSMSPMVYGTIKPTLVLPDIDLTDDELSNVIMHELMHVKNHDVAIKTVYHFMSSFYWWNPLIYKMNSQIDNAFEFKCDLDATKEKEDLEKINYISSILKIFKNIKSANYKGLIFASSFINDDNKPNISLKKRFEVILNSNSNSRKYNTIFLLLFLVLFFASYTIVIQPYSIPNHSEEFMIDDHIYATYIENQGYKVHLNNETSAFVENKTDLLKVYPNIKIINYEYGE